MRGTALGSGETKLEDVISYVLIIGVVISLVLETTGIVLFYRVYGSLAVSNDSQMFLRAKTFLLFLTRHFSGSSASRPIRMISLGIAVLILTPYVRALLSVIYFAVRGNGKYLVITLVVLVVLTVSLLIH